MSTSTLRGDEFVDQQEQEEAERREAAEMLSRRWEREERTRHETTGDLTVFVIALCLVSLRSDATHSRGTVVHSHEHLAPACTFCIFYSIVHPFYCSLLSLFFFFFCFSSSALLCTFTQKAPTDGKDDSCARVRNSINMNPPRCAVSSVVPGCQGVRGCGRGGAAAAGAEGREEKASHAIGRGGEGGGAAPRGAGGGGGDTGAVGVVNLVSS